MPITTGTHIAHLKSTLDVQGLITGATYFESKNLVVLCGYSKDLHPFIYTLYDFKGYDFFGGNKRKINISLPFHQVEGIASTNGLKYCISNEYFSPAPFVNVSQKLHILELSYFLGYYINNLYNSVPTQSLNNDIPFPNPATDFINFKTEMHHMSAMYRIINQSGNIVLTWELKEKNPGINISGLPAGVYILIVDKDKMQSIKVIK